MTRIGLLTDLHLNDARRDAVLAELERVVDRFESAFRPDRVFVLGDLIEDRDAAADAEHVREVRDVLESGAFPVTYLAGNHDVAVLTPGSFAAAIEQDRYGHWRVGDRDVLVLDSTVPGAVRGEISAEQLAFIAETLPEVRDALLLAHHPLGYVDLAESPWFATTPERALCTNKERVHDLLDEHGGVAATLSGHVHQTRRVQYRGRDHVVLNAFAKERPESDGVTGTYAELTIDDAAVEIDVRVRDRVEQSFALPLEGGDRD